MFERELQKLASRVVRQCLMVRKGENILIEAVDLDDYTLPEMMVSECADIGAHPVLVVTPEALTKTKLLKWTPEDVCHVPPHLSSLYENSDVRISVYNTYMPGWRHDIPPKNLAAFNEFHQQFTNMIVKKRIRNLNVSIPTLESVKERNGDFSKVFKSFLGETNVDYTEMAVLGNKLKKIFQGSKEICIESGEGAVLTLSAKGRNFMLEDGAIDEIDLKQGIHYAEIPAGELFTAPVEDSANGEVIFPEIPDIGKLRLRFKNGRVIDVKGRNKADFLKKLEEATGDKDRIAEFAIGLNPGSTSESEKALGSVHIAIGKNNHLGGKNESSLHWDMILPKPIVKVGEKLIIKKGKIV